MQVKEYGALEMNWVKSSENHVPNIARRIGYGMKLRNLIL